MERALIYSRRLLENCSVALIFQDTVCIVPSIAVVPTGLLYSASQYADVIGHHVIKSLKLLLDSLQLHSLCLSLLGPEDKASAIASNFPKAVTLFMASDISAVQAMT